MQEACLRLDPFIESVCIQMEALEIPYREQINIFSVPCNISSFALLCLIFPTSLCRHWRCSECVKIMKALMAWTAISHRVFTLQADTGKLP